MTNRPTIQCGTLHNVRYAIFWPILTLLTLSHFVTHPGTPQQYDIYLAPPRFLVGLVQITRTKAPCTNSLSIVHGTFVRGVLSEVFCMEGFVRGGFCPFPLLPEYICYNRKLNITLNFIFHVYDKKIISATSHALAPVTNCHTFSDPLP